MESFTSYLNTLWAHSQMAYNKTQNSKHAEYCRQTNKVMTLQVGSLHKQEVLMKTCVTTRTFVTTTHEKIQLHNSLDYIQPIII